jgi:hypothetical protein
MHKPAVMEEARRLANLSDAGDHLRHAHHELLSAGYGLWVDNLLELLEAITLEMEWLAQEGDDAQPSI